MTEQPVVLVTGSRKGLGRALAEHCLARGFRVVGVSRGPAELQADAYRHYRADVTDEAAVVKLLADIRSEHGRLDVLINNAGIAAMNSILLTTAEKMRAIFETNITGPFLLTREAAKLMSARRFGRIVNFTTVAVSYRLEGEAAYVASKAAVESLTRVSARELAPYGITVNAVGPTLIRTDLIRGVPPEKLDALIRRQAIPRFGTAEDVANVVDFFIRPESAFVTGQVLYLGGV